MPASCRAFRWQQQRKDVMLWIREPFLSDENDHGLYIVHGHTPTDTGMPDLRPNRLNLDTLAWYGNPLIAAVFDERRVGPLAFIADDGTITAAPRSTRASRNCTVREIEHARVERAAAEGLPTTTSAARRRRAPSRPDDGRWCCK